MNIPQMNKLSTIMYGYHIIKIKSIYYSEKREVIQTPCSMNCHT